MHIFDVILRFLIQAVVMTVWGIFSLAFVTALIGRTIRWLWVKTHPITAIVHVPQDDVVDAEWVREL